MRWNTQVWSTDKAGNREELQDDGAALQCDACRPEQRQVPQGPDHPQAETGRQGPMAFEAAREDEPAPARLFSQPVGQREGHEEQEQREYGQTAITGSLGQRRRGRRPGPAWRHPHARDNEGQGGRPGQDDGVPPPPDAPAPQARRGPVRPGRRR